jgi:hypothetical protein
VKIKEQGQLDEYCSVLFPHCPNQFINLAAAGGGPSTNLTIPSGLTPACRPLVSEFIDLPKLQRRGMPPLHHNAWALYTD